MEIFAKLNFLYIKISSFLAKDFDCLNELRGSEVEAGSRRDDIAGIKSGVVKNGIMHNVKVSATKRRKTTNII